MLQDELITQLRGPIPSGRRNNTLFAIGSQLKLAEVEAWEDMVHGRAIEVGLSAQEADKLVANIRTYA
jgi:ribosomal protein S10